MIKFASVPTQSALLNTDTTKLFTHQLFLSVYDPQLKLYMLMWAGELELCLTSQMTVYQQFNPQLDFKYTKANLRKRLKQGLSPVLEASGFKDEVDHSYSVFYRRNINGIEQLIKGWIEKQRGEYRLNLSFEVSFNDNLLFMLKFYELRGVVWDRLGLEDSLRYNHYVIIECRNNEEVDWIVDEILTYGLPIMEKASSFKGMNWLFNSPEAKNVFYHNRFIDWPGFCHHLRSNYYYRALKIARLANSSELDQYVIDQLKTIVNYFYTKTQEEIDPEAKKLEFDFRIERRKELAQEILAYLQQPTTFKSGAYSLWEAEEFLLKELDECYQIKPLE